MEIRMGRCARVAPPSHRRQSGGEGREGQDKRETKRARHGRLVAEAYCLSSSRAILACAASEDPGSTSITLAIALIAA